MTKNRARTVRSALATATFLALWVGAAQASDALDKGALDSGATFTPDGTAIVFHSYRDGEGELWEMNITTRNVKKITAGDNNDRWPDVSPDGSKIVFMSTRDANWEIYTASRDGTNLRRLTDNYVFNLGATWGPDGTSIAYAENREGPDFVSDIYLIDADGSNRRKIAEKGVWPDWSADGRFIVFLRPESEGVSNFVRYDTLSGEEMQITHNIGQVTSPRWSHDSKYINFVATGEKGELTLHRMMADGSNIQDTGIAAKVDSSPIENPDGTLMVFGMYGKNGDDVFLWHTNGSALENLTGQQD